MATLFQCIQVDGCGVMHDRCVVFPREYVSSSAHIGRKLVHLIHPVHSGTYHVHIAKVSDNKLISRRFSVFVALQVHHAHPICLRFEALYKMAANKPATTIHQYTFQHRSSLKELISTSLKVDNNRSKR